MTITIDRRSPTVTTHRRPIPLSRIVTTELRKTFDTRSGFWLWPPSCIAVDARHRRRHPLRDRDELTYRTFTAAISVPLTLALPIIAILSVTERVEPAHGLTTFTLVPHRGRICGQGDRVRRCSASSPSRSPSPSAPSATSWARPSPESTRCGT